MSMLWMLFVALNLTLQVYGRDLTSEPGHLKPFGSGRPSHPIEEVTNFPSAAAFFKKYVYAMKPLKMKGAAKYSEAFYNWNDEYFLSLEEPDGFTVSVETMKKEDRRQNVRDMGFREFVQAYNTSGIYMVDSVPAYIRKDVIFPCVLQCSTVFENLLVDNVMWFSSGGTKSVVHTDSVENINCLFRGEKDLVMVDPAKYEDKVDLDHPEGAYSGVDVDMVDYTKYPGLADVEFYHVHMDAGDCLYIPYKWIHQVRSYKSNLAVNIWWKKDKLSNSELMECNYPCDPEFTLDKVNFQGFSEMGGVDEMRGHLKSFLGPDKSLPFDKFASHILGEDMATIMKNDGGPAKSELMRELFAVYSILDGNKDGIVSDEDLDVAEDQVFQEFFQVYEDIQVLIENALEEIENKKHEHEDHQPEDVSDWSQGGQEVKDEL